MDYSACRFPIYNWGETSLRPTPSQWPLSHVRRSQDETSSSDSDSFEKHWIEDLGVSIPYHERTIKDISGRSMQEAFSNIGTLKRVYPVESSDGEDPVPSKIPDKAQIFDTHSENQNSSTKNAPPSRDTSRSDHGKTRSDNATKARSPERRRPTPEPPEISPMVIDEQLHSNTSAGAICLPLKRMAVDPPSPKVTPSRRKAKSTTTPSQNRSVNNVADEGSSTQRAEPSSAHRPLSRVVRQGGTEKFFQGNIRGTQRKSVPTCFLSEQSGEDDDDEQDEHIDATNNEPTDDELPGNKSSDNDTTDDDDDDAFKPRSLRKAKSSKQQGVHVCKICKISFTRNFDLQRHNLKHKTESKEDQARRTCTNCGSVLSRVDATKRHVNTIPESCNYSRRKDGLPMLPEMSKAHYAACKAKYSRLAEETKKPKGRKKFYPDA